MPQVLLERADAGFGVVKDRRGQGGVGARRSVKTSTKWSSVPAPPDAMTGIETARDTAAVISQSKPTFVPSRSIDVSRISPAPRDSASRAHSTASRSAAVCPLRA